MQIREQFAIHQRENTSGSPSSASINAVAHVLGGASREPPDNSNSSASSAPRAAVGSWWLQEFFNVSVGSLRSCRSADVTLNCRYLWGRKSVFCGSICEPALLVVCVCQDVFCGFMCAIVTICPPRHRLDRVSIWNIPFSGNRKEARAVFRTLDYMFKEERLPVLTSSYRESIVTFE